MAALQLQSEHRSAEIRKSLITARNHRHVLRRHAILLIATALALIFVPLAHAAPGAAEEYRIKAAFIYHFMQLVDWPDASFDGGAGIDICTVGGDPFRGELENAMQGKTVHSRSIRVKHLRGEADYRGCEVIFLSVNDRTLARNAIGTLGSRPVLTIADGDWFLRDGFMISFRVEENKVRFEINLRAAEAAQLKVSSRLLLLAKTVIGKPGS